ncbi:DUF3408 domain-containing protein [Porphyromonas canoris]|uniref:DUF3408 domain-containing protein n=1 Tax=Porphyromonas canoris TaxID=36875 RepID=A0ABR4XL03_9PORP|nr:DUF3408 domain-containing protein [Porphyromonas canoris]KGN92448.1 hypothetical protein HQ43_05350 [Porphyromonas canoris]
MTQEEKDKILSEGLKRLGNYGINPNRSKLAFDPDEEDDDENGMPNFSKKFASLLQNPPSKPKPQHQAQPSKAPTPPKIEEPVVKQGLAQKRERLAQFQEKYLQPQRISHRKAVYVSEETLKSLDLVVRRIGERGATISGYVERILREHLEQYKEDVEVWRKL